MADTVGALKGGLDSLGLVIIVKSGVNKGIWYRDSVSTGGHKWSHLVSGGSADSLMDWQQTLDVGSVLRRDNDVTLSGFYFDMSSADILTGDNGEFYIDPNTSALYGYNNINQTRGSVEALPDMVRLQGGSTFSPTLFQVDGPGINFTAGSLRWNNATTGAGYVLTDVVGDGNLSLRPPLSYSTVTIISDSSFQICNNLTCDTFYVNQQVSQISILNDSTLFICDLIGNCDSFSIPHTVFPITWQNTLDVPTGSITTHDNNIDLSGYYLDILSSNSLTGDNGELYIDNNTSSMFSWNDSTQTRGWVDVHPESVAIQAGSVFSPTIIFSDATGISLTTPALRWLNADTGPGYILTDIQGDGNLTLKPPVNTGGGDEITIINDTTIMICSQGTYLCDTFVTTVLNHIQTVRILSDTSIEVCDSLGVCDTLIIYPVNFTSTVQHKVVYDEHIAAPVEFTPTYSGAATHTFDGLIAPFTGTKDIDVGSYTNANQTMTFTNVSLLTAVAYENLTFQIKLKAAMANNANVEVTFLKAGNAVSKTLQLNSAFGFNKAVVGTYQPILIPIASFTWPGGTVFDAVRIRLTKSGSGVYIDLIQLNTGASVAVGTDINPYVDSKSPNDTTLILIHNDLKEDTVVFRLGGGTGGSGGIGEVVARNGLSNINDSTVELGSSSFGAFSPLLHTTYINTGGYGLQVTGASSTSLWAISSTGQGLGVQGATTGASIQGGTLPLWAFNSDATNPDQVKRGLLISRNATFTAAAGEGISLEFGLRNSAGSNNTMAKMSGIYTDPTSGAVATKLVTNLANGAGTNDVFTLYGTGAAALDKYGLGTFTGTEAYRLAVDASGNIIEVSGGGGSGLSAVYAQNGLGAIDDSTVELGAPLSGAVNPLLHNTWINTGAYQLNIATTGSGIPLNVTAAGGQAMYVESSGSGSMALIASGLGAGSGGIQGNSDGNSYGGIFRTYNSASNNSVTNAVKLMALNGAGPSDAGFGTGMDFELMTTDFGTTRISNQVISKWLDAVDSTRISELSIKGVDAGVEYTIIKMKGTGIFELTRGLPAYADNAAAVSGGLTSGQLYRISSGGTSTVAIVE
jgi:hypothetical protein